MNNILKSIAAAFLMMMASSAQSNGQVTADMVLTGGPNLAIYPGFVTTGSFNVNFSNGSGNTLPAQSFVIVLSLPTGIEFDAAYPGCPAGWQYTVQPGNLSVNLRPMAPVSGIPPASFVQFSVPFKTMASLTNQPYLGQIQVISPAIVDPDGTNNTPQGTVSVQNTPLPVSFEQFTAAASGCNALLNWTTGHERNNKYFDVERSLDGSRFESIGKVDAKGTSTSGATYSFIDKSPANGKNYYRIRQFDADGQSTSTHTLNVAFNCSTGKIELYPNPTAETVYIKGLAGKNTIKIFNAAGQLVIEETTEDTVHGVKLTELASGVYQVQVVRNAEIMFNSKFIKDTK